MAEIRILLLDLLTPTRAPTQAQLDELEAADWDALQGHLREHRLAPLLHWLTSRSTAPLSFPEAQRDFLQKAFRASGLRALKLQAVLRELAQRLNSADIPFVALKGAFLAFHAYPHPAMRPMRDIDLLLPPERALEVFTLLLAAGWTRCAEHTGDPAACLEANKHLPPLLSPQGKISVELHSRLFDPRNHAETALPEGFHQRCVTAVIADTPITFESPTDLLLHLIVHAVYDHQFDNGPLLLSDIAYLLAGHTLDWPLFWTLAGQRGYLRGCMLVLKLVERDWGITGIAWPEREELPPAVLLDQARLLMLRSVVGRRDTRFGAQLRHRARPLDQLCFACSKLFRPRREIAAHYPIGVGSPWLFLWYPVEWSRLLLRRLPEFLRARANRALRSEMKNLGQLERWLI